MNEGIALDQCSWDLFIVLKFNENPKYLLYEKLKIRSIKF